MAFKRGMKVELFMGYIYTLGHFDDLDLDAVARQREKCLVFWIISTTAKQAIKIKLVATVGLDKFYFSFKSLVPIVLKKIMVTRASQFSPKTYVRSLVSQCLLSEPAFGVQMKDVILLSPLQHHLDIMSNETMFPFHQCPPTKGQNNVVETSSISIKAICIVLSVGYIYL